MKMEVRPFECNDLHAGIGELLEAAFPRRPEYHDTEWYASLWRWLETHPLANETYRWVLTLDGAVAGSISALPLYYRISGRRVVAHTPGDFMVHPQHGFHALALMRTFFRSCQNCVSVDQFEATIKLEKWMGAVQVQNLTYAAKLLDAPRHAARHSSAAGRLPGHLLRASDNVLGASFGGGLSVEVLDGFDQSFDRFFEAVAAAAPCMPEKGASFLNWRYGPGSPHARATILGVRDGERLLGYAVLFTSQRGRDGYLLDLVTLPGRREVARALLVEALRCFRRDRAYIVRYRFLESPNSPRSRDLGRLGFFFRTSRRSTLLAAFADPELHKAASTPNHWSYSVGDGEGSYWVL